jgi:phosphoribosylamine---glycine ligase
MRILVLGSGGREHALTWKLQQEAEVFAAPGNPGIGGHCETFDIAPTDHGAILSLVRRLGVDLVVVGPEAPLIDGLADTLRASEIPVFGPGADGARLEGDKAFSKDLMAAAEVPTAEFMTCHQPSTALRFARDLFDEGKRAVVKASGAALGKGVVVCPTFEEAEDAIRRMMVERELGAAGETVVVERCLTGREFSLLTLCSNGHIHSLPVAQDYKRIHDGDLGPNTGGMGTYSPVPGIDERLVQETEDRVVRPMLAEMGLRGTEFRGVLFSGLMVEDGIPYCLEYNVRFGDPETQSVLPRLGKGFADALRACALGTPIPPVEVLDRSAVTVVLASEGYPGTVRKGVPITFAGEMWEDVLLFHAGTALSGGRLVTNGGRVFGVTGIGTNLADARRKAYTAAESVHFEGIQFRRDIGSIV